jgi:sulfoxide reductase catalytic subunit YedY
MVKIDPSEITPEHLYHQWRMNRRAFLKRAGVAAAGAVALAACGETTAPTPTAETAAPTPAAGQATSAPTPTTERATSQPTPSPDTSESPEGLGVSLTPEAEEDELGNKLTTLAAINNFNNFYEFSLGKEEVAFLAEGFVSRPWSVQVGGLVENPKTYSIDELYKFTQQERIYRLRCVEAWSMVIPWVGFPLAELLEQVKPTSEAQFVRFETLYDPDRFPNQQSDMFPWPYVEGLRLDEAMHDLTILATGIYGKPLLPQTGAPIRLVVPWKYGFKYIKSIVKIELTAEMPTSLWMAQAPHEYGFYANVNPNVHHPRWSQATERLVGKPGRVKTLMFNGYEDKVVSLYEGMDLRVWF